MRNIMADRSNIDNKESDNAFEGSDGTIITNSDVDISDLDKLKNRSKGFKNVYYRPVIFSKTIDW